MPDAAQYASQMGLCLAIIHNVNCAVAPEPSERTTGTIARAGIVRPGLSATIAGSFHCLMMPVKIFETFSPDSRKFVTRWPLMTRLYMNAVPPAVTGM